MEKVCKTTRKKEVHQKTDYDRAMDDIKILKAYITELECRLDNTGDIIEEMIGFINIKCPSTNF